MAIIVNADDFGLSHEVNLAICEAFKKGLINRTTLMANMPFAKEAMDMAVQEGFVDRVGLHLNLTAGKPLSDFMSFDRIMCDENGMFTADFARNIKTRFFLPRDTSKRVEEEIRMQLNKYRELGGVLWHVDSHHHVHTDPSVWKAFRRAVKKDETGTGINYPISGVRLGRNMYRGGNPLMHIYKAVYNSSVRKYCKNQSDFFGSMEDYKNYFGKEAPKNLAIEIMVHPMYSENRTLMDSDRELERVL